MCNYIYQIHRACNHRTIQLQHPCKEVYFAAGLNGFLVAHLEMLYESQLNIMIKGLELDQSSVWTYWEGYCEACVHRGVAPSNHKTEVVTTSTVPMHNFLPTHEDYTKYLQDMQDFGIQGRIQDYLYTLDHPFIHAKHEIISLPSLLGVEDQEEIYHGQTIPMYHFQPIGGRWTSRVTCIQRWVMQCEIWVGEKKVVDNLETKDWALVRNKGHTLEDSAFINQALMQGIDWEIVYQFRFEQRGMLKETFEAHLIKPHYHDGPSPIDDLLQAFDWNDLCRAKPGYEHLMIPIPGPEVLAKRLAWNNLCLSVEGWEERQVSMLEVGDEGLEAIGGEGGGGMDEGLDERGKGELKRCVMEEVVVEGGSDVGFDVY